MAPLFQNIKTLLPLASTNQFTNLANIAFRKRAIMAIHIKGMNDQAFDPIEIEHTWAQCQLLCLTDNTEAEKKNKKRGINIIETQLLCKQSKRASGTMT